MKVYEGLEAQFHSFFRFILQMQVSGQSHILIALPREKRPRCPLMRKLGGSQRQSGRFAKEENLLLLPRLHLRFLG